ncbi:SIR2 family protein, partial [bacterium]|nr:SIR2 family protein [bacterium]
GRDRVFSMFIDWACERPVVFVGYDLKDPNFRSIIINISKQQGELRPRYYMVTPDVNPIEVRMWEKKHITMLSGTFEDFLTTADSKLASPFRGLKKTVLTGNLAITERFIKKDVVLNDNCIQFLNTDVDYVKAVITTKQINPKDFYKGINPGWSAIEQNLDIRRGLVDTILSDYFLDGNTIMDNLQFIVVKGHAGAGKSTLLHRIAWDAAHDYDKLCLYLNASYGVINTVALQQLIVSCKERIYLFVEDAPNRIRELELLTNAIGKHGKYLTVISSARINEWNMTCENLSSYVTDEYELKYLSHKDINSLLKLLEKHGALGNLSQLNMEDRRKAFVERAGRQLLVALHEATLGKSFEEIITDEYNNIKPTQAQNIYLTICVLNRFDVAIRAGLISRIHGVTFEEFSKNFFLPLERIVQSVYNPIIGDYLYRTRHAHISEMIFEDILRKPEEKYNEYLKCLHQLNLSYETDRLAFTHMIRGRTLLEIFPDHSMVKKIYKLAEENAGQDQYLLHQMGLYEMNRTKGNLRKAEELLNNALELSPNNQVVLHSIAECYLKCAETARTELEKSKSLDQATKICLSLKKLSNNTFAISTLVKISLLKLKDVLKNKLKSPASESLIEKYTKDIEKELSQGLQKFPMDSVLLSLESKFASLIMEYDRAIESLQKSFYANPRNAYIAIRLADCQKRNCIQDAEVTLKRALEEGGFNRKLHYAYGKLLLEIGTASNETLEYHFRRSYSPGDSNFDAQL